MCTDLASENGGEEDSEVYQIGGDKYSIKFKTMEIIADLFKKKGLNYPNKSWTFDDFLLIAQKLTDSNTFGVSFEEDKLGALIFDVKDNSINYYFTVKVPVMFHGTGDCFASSFFGALIKGHSLLKATEIACEFTALAIQKTYDDKDTHWYGVHFEEALKYLTNL